MSKISENLRYWSQLLWLPVYMISYLMPRDKRIWAFGSSFGQRFADNPKYFFLYISKYQKGQVRPVWISKNKEVINQIREAGFEAYHKNSGRGIWYSLRAKVYFYDNYSKDISYPLSGGALRINLWHGIPLKKIQKDNIFDYVRNPRSKKEWIKGIPRRISDEKPSHYVLTTSRFLVPIFQSAFRTKNVIVNGYPRNDSMAEEFSQIPQSIAEKDNYEKMLEKKKDHRIILYMPTFRQSEEKFFHVVNLKSFEQHLENNKLYFVVKLHPKSKLNEKFSQMQSEYIQIIDKDQDPYVFLPLVDQLVTDYSSIFFDFLLLDRPIVFFPYDMEEYLSNSRELYFSYDTITPGPKVYNGESLGKTLLEEDTFQEDRREIRKRMFDQTEVFAGSFSLFKQIQEILIK